MITLSYGSIIYALLIVISTFFALSRVPILKRMVDVEGPGRYPYLDPLRGIAASLVLIHHSVMLFNLHETGVFSPAGVFKFETQTAGKIYTHFGQASVMFFFMITGFLFFGKIINFGKELNTKTFFVSRFKRLVPAMISCFALYIAAFMLLSDGSSEGSLLQQFISWLSFGMITPPRVSSDIAGWAMTAGVFWTLSLEWKFYLLVPMFASIIRNIKAALIFLTSMAVLIFYCYTINEINEKTATIYLCFISGMFAATIVKTIETKNASSLSGAVAALIGIGVYVATFSNSSDAYNFLVLFSVFVIFFLIVSGNSFFGLLKLPPLHWAGKCSYSTYIMHALVMNIVFYLCHELYSYEVCIIIAIIAIGTLSILNYAFIESRFMSARVKNSSHKNGLII